MPKHKSRNGSLEEREFMRTLGHRLAQRRNDRGFSQYELAFVANTARNMISAYECGHSMPSSYTLYKISEALGVSISYFTRPASETVSL